MAATIEVPVSSPARLQHRRYVPTRTGPGPARDDQEAVGLVARAPFASAHTVGAAASPGC